VVKCHLEGKTQQDAARELGITYATLRRRLKEARGMLRTKLSERGFAQNGCLLIPMLGHLAAGESVSAQTAVQVTQTVVASSTAQATAAATTAAAGGSAVALGTKLLTMNPLVKAALAGALLLGIAGTWWLVRFQPTASVEPESAAAATADSTTREKHALPEKPTAEEQFLEAHFGYVLQNGQLLTPEFEDAAKALNDRKSSQAKAVEANRLNLPELSKALVIAKKATPEPLWPKTVDMLSQDNVSNLREPVPLWDQTSDPNAVLLAPMSRPQPAPDPLPVDKVMEFLKDEQERRSQFSVGPALPSSSQFFGSPAEEPGKTLKVYSLP
jgi:hypothetical protein